MHRLIYISRSLIGNDPDALDALVDRSAACNQERGVTGMLWSDDASFAQVLEGEHEAVAETMKSIRADTRHTDIEVILDRPIEKRMFGHWAMVLPNAGVESTAQTAHLIGFAAGEGTPLARRLYDIVMAAFEQNS